MLSRRSAPGWLVAYVVVAGLNVIAAFADLSLLSTVTKPLLMPALLGLFVSSLDGLVHPLGTWVKRALVFSWAGDLLLMGDGDAFFVLGLLGFLAAQICYVIAFRPSAALGPLRSRPWLAIPYVLYGVGLLWALLPDLDALLIPVVIYAATLVAMAVLATGVSPTTAVGAILFLISDSLIASTRLSDILPTSAAQWVMPTYLLGQLLIVLGVLQNLGRLTSMRSQVAYRA